MHWPDPTYKQSESRDDLAEHWSNKSVCATGHKLAGVVEQDLLIIDGTHESDELAARLTVEIDSWLRDWDWYEPIAQALAFTAVGTALIGG